MSDLKLFLGGEGKNELGSRCGETVYQSDESPGVIEALLRRVPPDGWTVIGACKWCNIVKLRARGPSPSDQQNVRGLALEARRAGASILAFTRDSDDDKARPRVISDAIRVALGDARSLSIVGAAAVPALEGWLLALLGEGGTEIRGKSAVQKAAQEKGIVAKNTPAMVEVVRSANFQAIPKDARSLRSWLNDATNALPAGAVGA